MNSVSLVVLSLAVFGASAAPCGGLLGVNSGVVGCGSALPGPTFVGQTPVVENPASFIPTIVPQTSVSQSCHCMKTLVRPQIRTEIITAPSVDRLVRYVPSPVVEVISTNCGGNTRNVNIPTCGVNSVVSDGIVGGYQGSLVGGYSGVVGGCSGSLVGAYPGVVSGVFPGTFSGSLQGVGCGCGNVVDAGIVGNVGCGSNVVV